MYIYVCVCIIYKYICMYTHKTSDTQAITHRNYSPPTKRCPASPKVKSALLINSPLFFKFVSHGMEYPFGHFWSAVLVLSPPSSLCPKALLLTGQQKKLRNCPWLLSTAQQ